MTRSMTRPTRPAARTSTPPTRGARASLRSLLPLGVAALFGASAGACSPLPTAPDKAPASASPTASRDAGSTGGTVPGDSAAALSGGYVDPHI